MEISGGRLISACGLPGSGKTTYAKQLEARFPAVRFCPDEWMDALSLDLWDEAQAPEGLLDWADVFQAPSPDETALFDHAVMVLRPSDPPA